jgi:hypothetical protein
MMRMQILPNPANPPGQPDPPIDPILRIEPQLRARGIALADEHPDFVLAETGLVHLADPAVPLILFDECDGGMLWWANRPEAVLNRQWLKCQRVRGMFKIARYHCRELYNQPWIEHAYHMQRVADASPGAIAVPRPAAGPILDDSDYAKIHPLFGFWAASGCERLAARALDVWAERTLDVFCAGTVWYDSPSITHHRHLALEQLERLHGRRVVLGRGRVLPDEVYADVLCSSKICVAPWGWGETTIRDYEAMYAGCVLIKPLTDFIDSNPVVDERHYLPCAVDFSDLAEQIDHVLTHWHDYTEMRLGNRERILACWQRDAMADLFVERLRRCLD